MEQSAFIAAIWFKQIDYEYVHVFPRDTQFLWHILSGIVPIS